MMGAKEKTLRSRLATVGSVTKRIVPYLNYNQVAASQFASEVDNVYRALGGSLPTFPVNFRGWDIEFEGIAIELDEQLHFNRYRAITLASTLYSKLSGFPLDAYLRYCEEFEGDCLRAGKHGGRWTNPSCEKQFGKPGNNGNLAGDGAPRWKQRAFYDFVKDLSPLIIDVPVARIAIWDNFGNSGETINHLLEHDKNNRASKLAALIRTNCFSSKTG